MYNMYMYVYDVSYICMYIYTYIYMHITYICVYIYGNNKTLIMVAHTTR